MSVATQFPLPTSKDSLQKFNWALCEDPGLAFADLLCYISKETRGALKDRVIVYIHLN